MCSGNRGIGTGTGLPGFYQHKDPRGPWRGCSRSTGLAGDGGSHQRVMPATEQAPGFARGPLLSFLERQLFKANRKSYGLGHQESAASIPTASTAEEMLLSVQTQPPPPPHQMPLRAWCSPGSSWQVQGPRLQPAWYQKMGLADSAGQQRTLARDAQKCSGEL